MEEHEEEIPEPQPRPDHIKKKTSGLLKNAVQQIPGVKCKYTLNIPITSSQTDTQKVNTVQELKQFMHEVAPSSLYRGEIEGIVHAETHNLVAPEEISEDLAQGEYTLRISTQVDEEELTQRVLDGVENLKKARPLHAKKISGLENKVLTTKFTHASLTQEGSTMKLDEIVALANSINGYDNLRKFDDVEMAKFVKATRSSEKEVFEAVNHIQVSRRIPDLLKSRVDEGLVLELHRQLMERLLTDEKNGHEGEYRKVGIAIHNSKNICAHSQEVPEKMKALFVTLARGQREGEDLPDFLTRIHSEFQTIHPFLDGNGRIGRVIMNILALQQGFPVIFYTPEQQKIFWSACDQANSGDRVLFRRMLLEAFYASLREYETVVPNLLQ